VTLRSTFWNNQGLVFASGLAVVLAAFLFGVGLGPDRLPFPPQADFSDAVTSHWPNALFLRRSILDYHAFPLWRPLIMSGQPFAANPLNKVWYPPQWLVLIFPPTIHLNILIWLHLLIGGIGAWTWSRATGLNPWPAAIAGFGYALAPRILAAVGAGHLDLVYAAAWFPWLLWAAERLARAEPRSGVWLGGLAVLCFLADVRLSAYLLAVTGAYLLWRWWDVTHQGEHVPALRVGAQLGSAALLAAGLSAFQWVPLLLYSGDLSRGDLSLDAAAINSMKPGEWVGLLIGNHGGAHETLVYVGVSTLVLAVVALLMRPRQLAFWGVILLLVILYAMGDNSFLWTALNKLIPPLRWWRGPPRVWFVAALILPYLAGWGAQLLIQHPPDRRIARLSVVALLGGGLVCGVFSTLTLSASIEATALIGTFALPAIALVMLLVILGTIPARTLAALFVLVVVADVLWIDRTLVEGRGEDEWLEPYRELADYLNNDGAVRIYSPSYSLPQQAAAYWEIPQFGGVDPFQFSAYVEAAEAATGVKASGYSVTIPAYEVDEEDIADDETEADILARANRDAPINPELLGQWLVTHVVSAFEIGAEGLELDKQIETPAGTVYVYRNTLAPVVVQWNWPGRPNWVMVTAIPFAGFSYPEKLFVVAGGRWLGHHNQMPGLPGKIDVSQANAVDWIYDYDPQEILLSVVVASALLAPLLVRWWRARHV
jgi:hypothetical protein